MTIYIEHIVRMAVRCSSCTRNRVIEALDIDSVLAEMMREGWTFSLEALHQIKREPELKSISAKVYCCRTCMESARNRED